MKPCEDITYATYWLVDNEDLIIPNPVLDKGYSDFLNFPFSTIEPFIKIATAFKINGVNQSFISIAKELYPNAIAHCEFYISPEVSQYYHQTHNHDDAEKLITVGLGYFLYSWFDQKSLFDASILSYWNLAPGSLNVSLKRKKQFEEGRFDIDLKLYMQRNNISFRQYEYCINKLKMDGISNFLGLLNPYDYLEYQHVMDVLMYYLYKDAKRAAQLAVIYFPYSVIEQVLAN